MAKTIAIIFGIVFVLVGLLGFIPNPLVGANALFETDALHNLVHLVIGLVLLYVGTKKPAASARWLTIFGVIYLVLAVLGFLFISGEGLLLGIVHINGADNWLHLVLGVVLLAFGLKGKGSTSMPPAPMPMA